MALENIIAFLGSIFDSKFINLFFLTIALTLSMIIIWIMYMHLSKKDIFIIPKAEENDSNWKKFFKNSAYFLKYVILFPVYSFIWFIIFSAILIFMSRSSSPENILFFGIVLIASVRVSAYISEKLSEEIAKLLPIMFISTIIVNPGFLALDFKAMIQFFSISTIAESTHLIPYYLKYLLFIIFLEWILRLGNIAVDKIREHNEHKAK